jgi:hypothetical protein
VVSAGTGVVHAFSIVKLRQITDGASKTILFGEKYIRSDNYDVGPNAPFNQGNNQGWCQGWDLENVRWTLLAPKSDSHRRDVALGLIDEHEGFDRGWYAGPIGWIGPEGDGDLMVALRSGIVERTRVTLFAGCGIVADSDPDREWDESRMKLRAVAAALGRPGDEP